MSSSTASEVASEVPVVGRALTGARATVKIVCGCTVWRLIKPGGAGARVGAASMFLRSAGGAGVAGVGGRSQSTRANGLGLSAGVALP